MVSIQFGDKGLIFKEETFGGLDTSEFEIPYDELGKYEVAVDMVGEVPLDQLILTERGNPEFDFSALEAGEIEIQEEGYNQKTEREQEKEQSTSVTDLVRSNMPPIPDPKSPKWTDTDQRHYNRLVSNPDSQPAKYRRLIRNEGEISRQKFDRWAKRQGFEPETGGSHNASLLVLERIGEIERPGQGDHQTLSWVGE
jgi:hypothetical protein